MIGVRVVVGVPAATALACWMTGCTPLVRITPAPVTTSRAVAAVQRQWLPLRLSWPVSGGDGRPLVLYVTGDGGWRGKDLEAFERLIEWGYPVVGVSAPDYLDHLADGATQLGPRQLSEDLVGLAATARDRLHLVATTPVVLVGVSRGADLVVVAAAQRALRANLLGVVAVGLTREEEYVHRARGSRRHAGAGTDDPAWPVRPYRALERLVVPVSVIQSTRDGYVAAAEARRLMGPDSPSRRLQAIDAADHSFSDAREALYMAMRQSLAWISSHAVSNSDQVDP